MHQSYMIQNLYVRHVSGINFSFDELTVEDTNGGQKRLYTKPTIQKIKFINVSFDEFGYGNWRRGVLISLLAKK